MILKQLISSTFFNNEPLIIKFNIVILLFFASCASVKQLTMERDISEILKTSPVFSRHFTGFSLYDADKDKFIINHNSNLLFTPASNTKLLTMYVALKSFQDSIPGLLYQKQPNSLLIKAVGDPTFLHPAFPNQETYNFLSSYHQIELVKNKITIEPYGTGWAWDDHVFGFQAQRSWFTLYGNTVRIKKVDSVLSIVPQFFEDFVDIRKQEHPGKLVDKALHFNQFTAFLASDTSDFERIIPFEVSDELLLQLLCDTLNAEVTHTQKLTEPTDTLFSQHLDTVLVKMMKPSDNFLAEQLLIMSAWKNGYVSIEAFRKFVSDVWLSDLSDMVWVDGSGLSRYNLITPIDQVRLIKKSVDEFGWYRVSGILPTGSEGTLKELYLSEEPYIFAKTGTLSNNHNLSGLLVTRSGKRLIFSLMNNHYTIPTDDIKKAIEHFLIQIRNAY